MERSLDYLRLLPGTEARYERLHAAIPSEVTQGMADAGLRDYTGFRRGTDVWFYAEAEPDRRTAFGAIGASAANQRWGHEFRDVIAEIEAPGGGLIWFDEVFHTDAPIPTAPSTAASSASSSTLIAHPSTTISMPTPGRR